jgi:cobalamin biosynthesis Co2+ chelatase CbiK
VKRLKQRNKKYKFDITAELLQTIKKLSNSEITLSSKRLSGGCMAPVAALARRLKKTFKVYKLGVTVIYSLKSFSTLMDGLS